MAECSICFSEFSVEGVSVPYVLECAHSLCFTCLGIQSLQRCPVCRSMISRILAKKNFALIDSLARAKDKTVCSKCNCVLKSNKIRICLTCMFQKGSEWTKEKYSMEKCAQFYLCGDCVLDAHNTAEHSVKNISEVNNLFTESLTVRCRDSLSENVSDFYLVVRELVECEHDVVESFEKATLAAINQLENDSSGLDASQRSDTIIQTIKNAHIELDKIVRVNRLVMNNLKKAIDDLKSGINTESFINTFDDPPTENAKTRDEIAISDSKNKKKPTSYATIVAKTASGNSIPTVPASWDKKIADGNVRKLKTMLDSFSSNTPKETWNEIRPLLASIDPKYSTSVVQILFETVHNKPDFHEKLYPNLQKLFEHGVMINNKKTFPFREALNEYTREMFSDLLELRKVNISQNDSSIGVLSAQSRKGLLGVMKLFGKMFGIGWIKADPLGDFLSEYLEIKTTFPLSYKAQFSLHCVVECVISYLVTPHSKASPGQIYYRCHALARQVYLMRGSITDSHIRREIERLTKNVFT